MNSPSISVRFARDTTIITIVNALRSLKSFLLVPVLTRLLGTEQYGVWIQVDATLVLLIPCVLWGLDAALVRFLAAESDRRRVAEGLWTSLSAVVGAGVLVGAACWIWAAVIADALWGAPAAANVVRWTGLLIATEAVTQLVLRYFYARQQMMTYAVLTTAGLVLELAFVGGAVWLGHGVQGAVIGLIGFKAVLLAVSLGLVVPQVGWAGWSGQRLREFLAFGLPLLPAAYFWWLVNSSDRYVLGHFHGSATVGVYGLAYTLGSLPYTMLLTPLYFVLYPKLTAWWDGGQEELVRAGMEYGMRYMLLLTVPATVALGWLAKPVIRLMSTASFAGGAVIVPLVGSSFVALGMWVMGSYLFLFEKRTAVITLAYGIAGAGNLALNLLIVPRWGAMGAAISTLLAYGGLALLGLPRARQILNFDPQLAILAKSLLACLPMSLWLWWTRPTGLLHLGGSILGGALLYVSGLWILRTFEPQEVRMFRSFVAQLKGYGARG